MLCGALGVCLLPAAVLRAQSPTIADIKGKIFDARMAKQVFADGLKHCSELDGTSFYFQPRDRVLNLAEYHQSLENLARQGVFNPVTHRPWTEDDAADRWAQVQAQAAKDKANCALVANLPSLEKQLEEMEKQTGGADRTH